MGVAAAVVPLYLMSDAGNEYLTPLTLWDLATFFRAANSYQRLYHHEHPDVDDDLINGRLGADVLCSIPIPIAENMPSGALLPEPWDGAHRRLCEIWGESFSWLRRLEANTDPGTLEGEGLTAVTAAWNAALGCDDLTPSDFARSSVVDRR